MKIFEKYDVQLQPETKETVEALSWKDSKSVSELSLYLKKHKDFRLYRHGKDLVLHFDPGISQKDDPQRWEAGKQALSLLYHALDDLHVLIELDLIRIPLHPGFPGAGPSRKPET